MDKPVNEDIIRRILHAGMQAPSAQNTQPWEFVVTTDKATKQRVSAMSPFSGMARDAAALIVVLLNQTRILPRHTKWSQDLSACTQNILLQITAEGLGGCWLGVYPDEDRCQLLRDLFQLPAHCIPFSAVVLGYPEQDYQNENRFDPDRIHYDRY